VKSYRKPGSLSTEKKRNNDRSVVMFLYTNYFLIWMLGCWLGFNDGCGWLSRGYTPTTSIFVPGLRSRFSSFSSGAKNAPCEKTCCLASRDLAQLMSLLKALAIPAVVPSPIHVASFKVVQGYDDIVAGAIVN